MENRRRFRCAEGKRATSSHQQGAVSEPNACPNDVGKCTPSAPVRQNAGFHERRISGSS
jgi:hypothetical protein